MARQQTPGDEAGYVNQARHEPVPASHQDERPQAAAQRSEDVTHHVARRRGGSRPENRTPALDALSPEVPGGPPAPVPQGAAAEDLMGGPAPQGPVPDAPGVQVAAADTEAGRVTRIRAVSNAVPGHPDGEVDTRS